MAVVAIRQAVTPARGKVVEATQKSVDALPFDSGDWSVEGEHGLFVRCRAASKSFRLQRRINGELVKQTLRATTVKEAKAEARAVWAGMSLKPAAGEAVTFGKALDVYLQDKNLAASTIANYEYNGDRYLKDWTKRSLKDIGNDRPGVRALQRSVTKKYGASTANQVVRLLSSVYRWARREDPTLPEPPTVAVEITSIPARNWAMSDDDLKTWWYSAEETEPGKVEETGVKTLGPIQKMWWIVALTTGARAGSICWLKWTDLDFDRKLLTFTVTKGSRPYTVPMSDKLAELLTAYRDSGNVPPCKES